MPDRVVVPQGGFADNYPVAVSSGVPRSTVLRPLQQPLYDTELMPQAGRIELVYFARPVSQTFAFGVLVKSKAETNLLQSGQIPQPQEFLVAGFTFEVESNILKGDFDLMYTQSYFEFTFTGNRVYLELPLAQMPQGITPNGFASTTVNNAAIGQVANGLGLSNNIYKMTCQGQALKIMPTESFNARARWPNGAPNIAPAAGVRTRTYIRGLLFNAV